MRHIALLATAATVAMTALPASAQMRTTAPKAPAATSVSGAIVESGVRPTFIGGTERAQTLAPGSLLFGINAAGISFEHGLLENLELDARAAWNPGLTIAPALALTGGLNAGVGAKFVFINTNAISVGVNGGINLALAGGTANTNFDLGLPVSFWMGKSALHVMPGFTGIGTANTFGTRLAYERELNSKWRLYVSDNLRITPNNEILNNLGAGVRVAFTPNLTVDVGVATGNLDFNRLNNANQREFGLDAQATLLNFNAYFGTKTVSELRGLFGI